MRQVSDMRQQLVRGHLTGREMQTPPISCYPASDALRELFTGYWVPVWIFASAAHKPNASCSHLPRCWSSLTATSGCTA